MNAPERPPTTGAEGQSGAPRALRRDAQENRERVLAAAVTAMLREGRQVPMATIAAQAGVGVGTLYRRYPTREALLTALTERSFSLVQDLAANCADRAESGRASLERFLEGSIAQRDQLVLPLHGGPLELSAEATRTQSEVHVALTRILERGRDDGTLGAGVSTSDVIVFGAMLAQSLPSLPDWDGLARRQLRLFLAAASLPARPGSRSQPVREGQPAEPGIRSR